MNTEIVHIKTEKLLVPQLRFAEFEAEWTKKLLGKVAKITSGGTPSRSNWKYWNGEIPWVTTTLIDFNLISEAEEYITELAIAESSAKMFPKGTILMAMYGQGKTRGKVAILEVEATTNQACAAIIPSTYVDNIFLFQNLVGRYKEIRELSNQGGQQNLSGGIIKGIKFIFPTLPEQQKIAGFLTAVDTKIQQLTKKKVLLEQYKKGVIQQLFSQQLCFKQEDGSDYPDWEEKKLGEIGETFNGLTGKTKEDFGEGKPYVQYMQIFADSKINLEQCGYVSLDEGERQTRVYQGDIFFTTSSETPLEIGTSSVLLDDNDELYLNSFCFGYRPKSHLQPEFARYLFRSSYFRRKIIPLAQGSTRYNMSKKELLKLKVDLPSKEEQQKIASYLSALDTKIEGVAEQITQTQQFKKGLLQQMFV